jgi:hypothetical protein
VTGRSLEAPDRLPQRRLVGSGHEGEPLASAAPQAGRGPGFQRDAGLGGLAVVPFDDRPPAPLDEDLRDVAAFQDERVEPASNGLFVPVRTIHE